MSDDPQDKPFQADATSAERVLTESTYAELRKLKEYTLNGVRVVKRSNLGPITTYSTGSHDSDPRSEKLIPLEESKAIADAYLESLVAGSKNAEKVDTRPAPPSEYLSSLMPQERTDATVANYLENQKANTPSDEPHYLTELRKQTLRD
jgi:hypothetical protein